MKSPCILDMHHCGGLAIVAGALLAQSPAMSHCADDWLSITEVQTGDGVELYATNYQNYPITYALMIDQDVRSGHSRLRQVVPSGGAQGAFCQ